MAMIVVLVINVLFLAVSGRHLLSGENIAAFAKNNRSETTEIIPAKRGSIYSYDGDLIATDRAAYHVIVFLDSSRTIGDTPAYVDQPETTAALLADYVHEDRKKILEILKSDRYQFDFKTDLTSVQKEEIEQKIAAEKLHGIEFIDVSSRNYTYRNFASTIIGLVNSDASDPFHITRTGALGLEQAYDEILTGTDGKKVSCVDVNDNSIYSREVSRVEAKDGSDLYLAMDSELQNVLEVALDNAMAKSKADKMWCGVMDAKTGRIMAVASRPDFDTKDRSTVTNYQDLFLNYTYEVGSVMKPYIYLTAMTTGVYDGSELYQSGSAYVNDSGGMPPITDWNDWGWGMIPYDEGLVRSSNTAIVHLIQDKIDFSKLEDYLDQLGFYQDDTIDGLNAAGGWAAYKTTDAQYDRVTLGFGQAATYTGYELMRAISVLANDGCIVEPYLVDHIVNSDGETTYSATTKKTQQIFTKEACDHVRELLKRVVNDEIGTGTSYKMDDLEIFGKTGTGEIWDNDIGAYSTSRYYYSFVGGAPADDPRVLISIGMEGNNGVDNAGIMAEVVHQMLPQALVKLNVNATNPANKVTSYELDSYVNQSVDFAKRRLETQGVKTVVLGSGQVVKKQEPAALENISTASTVYLLTDDANCTLPDFKGWSRRDIAMVCQLLGIPVSFKGTGKAVSQSVEAGQAVSEAAALTIELQE